MNAEVSIRPLPSALATVTLPARTASTSPATPRNESERNSMGSQKLSSTRRRMTSTCLRPASVFRNTRLSRTVRSPPCTKREAEITRQVGMFEVGFVERPGRQQHHARIVAG